MEFGTIKSIEVSTNADGTIPVRLAQVQIEGEDVVTVELPFAEGDEFVPAEGDRVYYEEVTPEFLRAVCIQTVMPPNEDVGAGERELFSRSGDERAATIRLTESGDVVLNAGEDFGVRFAALEKAVRDMMGAINDAFDLIGPHTHVSNGPGAGTNASLELAVMKTPVEIDMAPAKAPKVKL